jgi:hypothetical protein
MNQNRPSESACLLGPYPHHRGWAFAAHNWWNYDCDGKRQSQDRELLLFKTVSMLYVAKTASSRMAFEILQADDPGPGAKILNIDENQDNLAYRKIGRV